MDARPRDRTAPGTVTPAATRPNRRPLAYVKFRTNVEVPGVSLRQNKLVAGQPLYMVEPEELCPQPFYDADLRLILIRDRYYPLEVVESFSFARAAINEKD